MMTTEQQRYPTVIGHSDLLLRFYYMETGIDPESKQPPSADETLRSYFTGIAHGHMDYPRAQAGSLVGAFCAVYIPNPRRGDTSTDGLTIAGSADGWYEQHIAPSLDFVYAQRVALHMMSRLLRLEAISEGRIKIPHTVDELTACVRDGVFATIFHIEGAEAIDPDLNALDVFYQAGLRSLGLVWSRRNIFGDGVPFAAQSPDIGNGLTDAGKALVRACNQLGIMIDLSHLNEKGFWDVARISQAPLVATHSNPYELSNSTRNLTDRQLAAIKESDGLVGINFNVKDLRADWERNSATPLETIVRHVDYLVEHVGLERVALGTDYDGALMPDTLSDVSKLPDLFTVLAEHGYDAAALQKIAFENWLRVLRKIWK